MLIPSCDIRSKEKTDNNFDECDGHPAADSGRLALFPTIGMGLECWNTGMMVGGVSAPPGIGFVWRSCPLRGGIAKGLPLTMAFPARLRQIGFVLHNCSLAGPPGPGGAPISGRGGKLALFCTIALSLARYPPDVPSCPGLALFCAVGPPESRPDSPKLDSLCAIGLRRATAIGR
jgi:hypothetical protein